MTDEHQKAVIEAIREKLPTELIDSIVKRALEDCFRHFSMSNDTISKLVMDTVIGRAKEMLKTTYKDDIEKQAILLATRVVTLLPELRMKEQRY